VTSTDGSDLAALADLIAAERDGAGRTVVVGITGGVAAGKTYLADALAAFLRAGEGLDVAVVSSDGFLRSNADLDRAGLSARKGFPESYDLDAIVRFVDEVRAGLPEVEAPRYDHVAYDVTSGDPLVVDRPEVLIFEGVNVLQPDIAERLDLAVYLHAEEDDLRSWYHARIRRLRADAPGDGSSFYDAYASISDDDFVPLADAVWDAVNHPNLVEHIAPTRAHADVVVIKRADHTIVALDVSPPRGPAGRAT
jgi:type I pantothenate kinase